MSIVSEFQQGANDIFSELGDLITPMSYHSVDVNTYNTNTGTVARTEVSGSPFSVTAILYNFRDGDRPVSITQAQTLSPGQIITAKVIIRQSELSVVPKEDDFLDAAFLFWEIKNIEQDPAAVIWLFEVEIMT